MATTRARVAGVAAVLVALGSVAGCGDDDPSGPPVLLVGTAAGVAMLETSTGTVGAPAPAAVSSPDGELLVRGDLVGTRTDVRAVDVLSGGDRWAAVVEGSFEPRAVSPDGSRVALTAPPGPLFPGQLAPGRERTDLAVLRDDGSVDRYDVAGNVEPEAFSLDGSGLFVVSFQPPAAPTAYRVRRLDLATGELGDVESVDGHLQESMQGTARGQVWDPDGSRLYTLYTQQVGADVVTFVHVLDLDEQWAHCIGLPAGFTPSTAGLALSDGGRELFVADTVGGVVASVDTEALAVEVEGSLPPVGGAHMSPTAVVGDEVLIGSGGDLLRMERSSLAVLGTLLHGADIVGVQRSTREGEVVVASAGMVALVDAASGEVLQRMWADQVVGSFTSLGGRSIPTYAGFECAC